MYDVWRQLELCDSRQIIIALNLESALGSLYVMAALIITGKNQKICRKDQLAHSQGKQKMFIICYLSRLGNGMFVEDGSYIEENGDCTQRGRFYGSRKALRTTISIASNIKKLIFQIESRKKIQFLICKYMMLKFKKPLNYSY